MSRSALLLTGALAFGAFASAQVKAHLPPPSQYGVPVTELKLSSERQLTMPDLDWYGSPQCDVNGAAYVHAAANFSDGIVVKLDVTKDDATVYQWRDRPAEMPFMAFSVGPSGEVWMLGQTKEAHWVVGFNSDGREAARSRIDLPAQFWPLRFAVFSDGSFLLSGFYNDKAPDNLAGTPFTGIFDRSGRLRYQLPDKTEKVSPSEARRKPEEASAIVGIDNNIYLLRPGKIQAISPLGELIREVPFSKPDPKAVATQMWLAGGRVAIEILMPLGDGRFTPAFLVLDQVTGMPIGTYKTTAGLGYLLCFSGSSFTFEKARQGRLVLGKANLP